MISEHIGNRVIISRMQDQRRNSGGFRQETFGILQVLVDLKLAAGDIAQADQPIADIQLTVLPIVDVVPIRRADKGVFADMRDRSPVVERNRGQVSQSLKCVVRNRDVAVNDDPANGAQIRTPIACQFLGNDTGIAACQHKLIGNGVIIPISCRGNRILIFYFVDFITVFIVQIVAPCHRLRVFIIVKYLTVCRICGRLSVDDEASVRKFGVVIYHSLICIPFTVRTVTADILPYRQFDQFASGRVLFFVLIACTRIVYRTLKHQVGRILIVIKCSKCDRRKLILHLAALLFHLLDELGHTHHPFQRIEKIVFAHVLVKVTEKIFSADFVQPIYHPLHVGIFGRIERYRRSIFTIVLTETKHARN